MDFGAAAISPKADLPMSSAAWDRRNIDALSSWDIPLTVIHRQLTDFCVPRASISAFDPNLSSRPERRVGQTDDRDTASEVGRPCAAADTASHLAVEGQGFTVTGDAACTPQPPGSSAPVSLGEGSQTDEVGLLQIHHLPEPGGEWCNTGVEIGTREEQSGFDAPDIRHGGRDCVDPMFLALCQDPFPDQVGVGIGPEVHLPTQLVGESRTADHHWLTADSDPSEVEVAKAVRNAFV